MTIAEPGPPKQADNPGPPIDASRTRSRFFPTPSLVDSALTDAGIGVWSWDIASNRVTWSSNMESIRGMPAGSFDGTFAFVENDLHPQDRAQVRAALEEGMRSGAPFRMLYRVPPRADGAGTLDRVARHGRHGERQGRAHVRHLPRRHRARAAAPGIATARQPAGSGGAARRTRADRDRPADLFRRHRGDHRADPRRRVREDPRAGAGRRRIAAARGRRLEAGARRPRACLHRARLAGRLHPRIRPPGDRREPARPKRASKARRCCAIMASSPASRARSRAATAAPMASSARIPRSRASSANPTSRSSPPSPTSSPARSSAASSTSARS